MNRRKAMGILAGAIPALGTARARFQKDLSEITDGPFLPSRESLRAYRVPEWFHDAKFGMWAHWGPQSAAEAGDWYARRMYIEGDAHYKFHLEHYGHPSKFGYKDVIQTWKGEKFDPDYLLGLYKRAGAKYFFSMGVHHDNFDLWNSKHTRWNAANMGPKKDIVGMFRDAARKHGLRFGVTDHLWISYKWFATSHMSDKSGILAGVPYDGADPAYNDLYHKISDPALLTTHLDWNEVGITEEWKQHWYLRIKDLVDRYQPEVLYSDGPLPFGDLGLKLLAHFYNESAKRRGGQVDVVYTSKRTEDATDGICVLDKERGVLNEIWPQPWQTDTCIGQWHYHRGIQYKTPKRIVDLLVDIVSRNGNLMLNFPLPSGGMLDDDELKILADFTRWMDVNGEAIFSTRPWKISGGGPSMKAAVEADAKFNERNRKDLSAEDFRFTTKKGSLYALVMGWPEPSAAREILLPPLGTAAGKAQNVELLGHAGRIQWSQEATGLRIALPPEKPCDHAVTFKVAGLA